MAGSSAPSLSTDNFDCRETLPDLPVNRPINFNTSFLEAMKTPVPSPKNSLKKQKIKKIEEGGADGTGYNQLKQQVGCIQKQIDLLTRHKIETCSSVTTNSRNSNFMNSNSQFGNSNVNFGNNLPNSPNSPNSTISPNSPNPHANSRSNSRFSHIEQDVETLKHHNVKLCTAVKDLGHKLSEEQQKHRMTVICLRNSERGRAAAVRRNQELQGEMHQFFNTFGGMFSKGIGGSAEVEFGCKGDEIYDLPSKVSASESKQEMKKENRQENRHENKQENKREPGKDGDQNLGIPTSIQNLFLKF